MIPVGFRWHLVAWRSLGGRTASRIRTYEGGRTRTVGALLAVPGLTVGVLRVGKQQKARHAR
jgi:hypothetical protein